MKNSINWAFKGLSLGILSLPRQFQLLIGTALGIFWFDILRVRRKVALDNLAIAFPEKTEVERCRIARSAFLRF